MTNKCITYFIDEAYNVVGLDEGWDSLAIENNAQHLLSKSILNKNISDSITDDKVLHLYELMFEKVKQGGKPLTCSFRCDSPDERRLFGLTIYLTDNNQYAMKNCILTEESRPYQALLDVTTQRNNEFLTICSWCQKIQLEDGCWAEVEEAVQLLNLFEQPELPELTHTICKECYEKQLSELSE